jgi:hypothetical protein
VAVVSEALARTYFADADPIGRAFTFGGEKVGITIVGVVEDARHEALRTEAPPRMVYTPLAQPASGLDGVIRVPQQVTVAMRTRREPTLLFPTIQQEIRALNKDAMVTYVRTMEHQIDATIIPERLLAMLSAAFAVVALALASVGLYGVIAYGVAQRTREIGIRMALGSWPTAIQRRVVAEALTISAVGLALGLAMAVVTTRILSTFLFGLRATDLMTLVTTTLIVLTSAACAGFIPARRAARVNPIVALRYE